VVGLWQLAALVNVKVGMGVVMVGGDRVVVVVEVLGGHGRCQSRASNNDQK